MADIISEPSFFTDMNGVEHQIYPMVFDDHGKVNRWFSKINDEFLYLNIPTPKLNRKGAVVINKQTKEPEMDYTAYNAMMSIFELAFHDSRDEIAKWLDLGNGVEVLDEFRKISGLKKKILQQMVTETLQHSSQQ
jgi:hypothetical protein